MPNGFIPTPHAIKVDTRGAVILQEESPEVFSLIFILILCALTNKDIRQGIAEAYTSRITSNLSPT
jgi:hypothetical protein